VGPRAVLDTVVKRKIPSPLRESNPDRPSRSPALYRLSYHGSCVYEVPRIIVLLNLKGAMRLGLSKDMSVHVSTCTSCYCKASALVVWKLWR
jgi:hypothetical protein